MKSIFILWFVVGSDARGPVVERSRGQCPAKWTEEWTLNFGRYLKKVFDLAAGNRKSFKKMKNSRKK